MEYNKRQFTKTTDKKVLHKVKKHWVVLSMALLMAMGGKAALTQVNTHADVANSDQSQTNNVNSLKERINANLTKQSQSNNTQQANDNIKKQNPANIQPNSQSIVKQATILHQRIVNNAAVMTPAQNRTSNGRVHKAVTNDGTQSLPKQTALTPQLNNDRQRVQNRSNQPKLDDPAQTHPSVKLYRASDGAILNSPQHAFDHSDYVYLPSDQKYVHVNFNDNHLPNVINLSSDDVNNISTNDLKNLQKRYWQRFDDLEKQMPKDHHLNSLGHIIAARELHDTKEAMAINADVFKREHPKAYQQREAYRAKVATMRTQHRNGSNVVTDRKPMLGTRLLGDSKLLPLPDYTFSNYDTTVGDRQWYTIYPSGDLAIHNGFYGGGYWTVGNGNGKPNDGMNSAITQEVPGISNGVYPEKYADDIVEENINNEIIGSSCTSTVGSDVSDDNELTGGEGNFSDAWSDMPNLQYCFMNGNKFYYGSQYPMIARNLAGPNKSDSIKTTAPQIPSSNDSNDSTPDNDAQDKIWVDQNMPNTNYQEFQGDKNLRAVQFDPSLVWMDVDGVDGINKDSSDGYVKAHMADVEAAGFNGLDLPHGTQWYDTQNPKDTDPVHHIFNGHIWATSAPGYAPKVYTMKVPVKIILCNGSGQPTGKTKMETRDVQGITHASRDINFSDFIIPGYSNMERGQVSLLLQSDAQNKTPFYTDNDSSAHWLNPNGGQVTDDTKDPILEVKLYHYAKTANFSYNDWLTGKTTDTFQNSDIGQNVNITESDALSVPTNYRFADGFGGNPDEDHFSVSKNDGQPNSRYLNVNDKDKDKDLYNFPVPVVNTKIVKYGKWGTAHWTLDRNGLLKIGNGGNNNATLSGPISNVSGIDLQSVKHVEFVNNVYAPSNSSNLFSNLSNVQSYTGMNNFDTSNATNMRNMFMRNLNISNMNISSFQTSKVKTFQSAFQSDSKLENVDGSDMNTSDATNMNSMFMNDKALNSLNLEGWKTSASTDMGSMFQSDDNLDQVTLSSKTNLHNSVGSSNIPFFRDNIDPVGSDTTSKVDAGNQTSDTYYTAEVTKIYFMDEDSSFYQNSGHSVNIPVTYDPKYDVKQQVQDQNLQAPTGYDILPDNKQDYDIQTDTAEHGKVLIIYVALQHNPVKVDVHYWDTNNNREVSSDKITTNVQGQTAKTGDTVNLPNQSNANSQYNLAPGYTLDPNQISTYQIRQSDYKTGPSGNLINNTKNITMLVTGNPIQTSAPVTIENVDEHKNVQLKRTVLIPVNGNVGDTIPFRVGSFQGFIPPGYHFAGADNIPDSVYNGVNYASLVYDAKLSPQDAKLSPQGTTYWNSSDTWKQADGKTPLKNNSEYWDTQNNQPLIILQADPKKSITFNFYNQNNYLMTEFMAYGTYNYQIDTSPTSQYTRLFPKGYEYGPDNPSSVRFALEPQTVNINLVGKPETLDVDYVDPTNHNQRISDYQPGNVNGNMEVNQLSDGSTLRIGDTVNLPVHQNQIPAGYDLASNAPTSFEVLAQRDPNLTGHIKVNVPVVPERKILPLKFVNQDNAVVGTNNSISGNIGQSITLGDSELPKGYQYANADEQHYTFDNSNVHFEYNSNARQSMPTSNMNTDTIRVVGDPETVPVRYIDQNGQLVTQHSDMVNKFDNGNPIRIGDTIQIPDTQAQIPSGFKIDADNNDQAISYKLWPSDVDSSQQSQMKPVNINVSSAEQTYQFVVRAKKLNNRRSRTTGINTVPFVFPDAVGQTVTFHPSDSRFIPDGYDNNSDDNNKPVTLDVTDTGLVDPSDPNDNNGVTWQYDPQENDNAFKLTYIDAATNQPVSPTYTLKGHVGDDITLTNHEGVPSGFYLDNHMATSYVVPAPNQGPKVVKLLVHNKNSNARYVNVNVEIEDPQGHIVDTSTSIKAITATENNSQTIEGSSYFPDKDSANYVFDGTKSSYDVYSKDQMNETNSSDHSFTPNSDGVTVHNYPNGLSTQNITFVYRARSMKSDANIKPITVKYIDQTKQEVVTSKGSDTIGSSHPSDVYMGETVNVTDPSQGGLSTPRGYTPYPGQRTSYTFGTSLQKAKIQVAGLPVNKLAKVHVEHLDSGNHSQNGSLNPTYSTIQLPITGQVGDYLKINDSIFDNYLPQGYSFANGVPYSALSALGYMNNDSSSDMANYNGHEYDGILTPSDASDSSALTSNEQEDTWQNPKISTSSGLTPVSGPYWDKNDGTPLIVLRAEPDRSIIAAILNQNKEILTNLPVINGDYNDIASTNASSPYAREVMIKAPGYVYDTTNSLNSGFTKFDLNSDSNPKVVPIFVAGRTERVHTQFTYSDQSGRHTVDGTSLADMPNNGGPIRVGDTIELPLTNLPEGYHLDNSDSLMYKVAFSDDPQHNEYTAKSTDTPQQLASILSNLNTTGDIYKPLKVIPDTEVLPVKFVDQDHNVVGSYQISGTIGNRSQLPSVPDGYTLDDPSSNSTYKFTVNNINPDQKGEMNPITVGVTGKPVTIDIHYNNDNGVTVGSDKIGANVDDDVTLPTNTNDAITNYKLPNNYELKNDVRQDVKVHSKYANGNKVVVLPVVGKVCNSALEANVVYSDGQGNVTAKSSNVPLNVTGQIDSTAYFDPANLAAPAGYTLDKGPQKTQSDYAVNITSSGASWQNGEPTIYFKGDHEDNDEMTINQVIESTSGEILKTVHTQHKVSGDVGSQYTVNPQDVTAPEDDTLAANDQPNANQNQAITGRVLDNGSNTYLSQPSGTFYYVDPQAAGKITVHYLDRNDQDLKQQPFPSEPAGTQLSYDLISSDVPSGYQLSPSDYSTQIDYGTQDKSVNVHVVGEPASVSAEYYDGQSDVGPAGSDQGLVGQTTTLATNNVPAGYRLATTTAPTYKFKSGDDSSHTTVKIQIVPNEMTLPIKYNYNGEPIENYNVQGRRDDSGDITFTSVKGYQLNSSDQPYNFKAGTVADNDANTMASDNVAVTPDHASVQVNVIDGSDKQIDTYKLSDQIGNSDYFHPAPAGYVDDHGQSNTYRFDPSNIISGTKGHDVMRPLSIYVHAGSSQSDDDIKPIYVTYKDGNQVVGQANQRVDGYMGQHVNVLHHSTLTPGYEVEPGTNVQYTIGTGATKTDATQKVTIPVVHEFGTITAKYYNVNDGQHQFINSDDMFGRSGDSYDILRNVASAPDGYTVVSVPSSSRAITSFNHGNQNVEIDVVPIRRYGRITVNYVNSQNNQSIATDLVTGRVGNSFDMDSYLDALPVDYSYVKTVGNVPSEFTDEDQSITVKIKP